MADDEPIPTTAQPPRTEEEETNLEVDLEGQVNYDNIQSEVSDVEEGFVDWVPFSERPEFQQGRNPDGSFDFTNPNAGHLNRPAVDDRITQLHELLRMAGGNPDAMSPEWVRDEYGDDVAEDFFGVDLETGLEAGSYSDYGFQATVSPWLARLSDGHRLSIINEFAGATNFEQQAAFYALEPADQYRLKQVMWSAGYYGNDRPTFTGGIDNADRMAFGALQQDQNANPDKPMNTVIANAERREMERMMRGGEGRETAQAEMRRESTARANRVVRTSDPLTISNTLKNFAQQELGMGLSDEVLDRYAQAAVAGERANLEAYYSAVDASQDSTLGDINVSEIDMFLQAVSDVNNQGGDGSIVSGEGGYRFSPASWHRVASSLGIDPRDNSPETQRTAARVIAANLYNAYGNDWRAAADRWHASIEDRGYHHGPIEEFSGNVLAPNALYGQQSNPQTFSNDVLTRMMEHESVMLERQASLGTGGGTTYVQDYDTNAHAQRALEAAYAADEQAWDFHQKGAEFFRLIAQGSRLG